MFQREGVEKIKRHILCSRTLFENRIVYEIMWKNMRFARWITKATNTHSQYVIFTTFPWQISLHERASLRLYVYCMYCCYTVSLSVSQYRST